MESGNEATFLSQECCHGDDTFYPWLPWRYKCYGASHRKLICMLEIFSVEAPSVVHAYRLFRGEAGDFVQLYPVH